MLSLLLALQTPAPASAPVVETAAAEAARIALVHKNFASLHWELLGANDWEFIGVYYGSRVLFVFVLMTLAITVSGWASSITRRTLERVKFDSTLTIFLAKLVRWGILTLVGVMCLSKFGVETASLAAVIGAAGLAIGLAFQGTLSNFAAGAMLLIFRPYKVGDTVVVAGHTGTVDEIELFTTTLDTPDRRRVIVPNSSIFGAVIENHTHHAMRRFETTVGAAYTADIDQTRAALDRAVKSVPAVATTPAPELILACLGASSVDWIIRGWAKRDVLGEAKQAVIRAVKLELDRTGIGIPYPQLEVHFDLPREEPQIRAA